MGRLEPLTKQLSHADVHVEQFWAGLQQSNSIPGNWLPAITPRASRTHSVLGGSFTSKARPFVPARSSSLPPLGHGGLPLAARCSTASTSSSRTGRSSSSLSASSLCSRRGSVQNLQELQQWAAAERTIPLLSMPHHSCQGQLTYHTTSALAPPQHAHSEAHMVAKLHPHPLESCQALSLGSVPPRGSALTAKHWTPHGPNGGDLDSMRECGDRVAAGFHSRPAAACSRTAATLPTLREWQGLEDFTALSTITQNQEHTVYVGTADKACKGPSTVIIKAFGKARLGRSTAALHSFCVEKRLLLTLQHNHIIRGLGSFEDPAEQYVVQEYADGRNVRQYLAYWLRKRQDCPPARPSSVVPERDIVNLILRPLLDALSYLHHQGIAHRDVKPENAVLTHGGCVKLIDFGLAVDVHEMKYACMAGTLQYMSPEVASGVPLDTTLVDRTDVWGIGVMAFQLLCGKLPIFHECRSVLREMLMECEIPWEALDAVAASQQGVDFVRRALCQDPRLRPTAAELLLHDWISGN